MTIRTRQLFRNAQIFTSNPDKPYANAMIVSDGRIEWIGDEKEIVNTEINSVNLRGQRVLPGFIDAHLHPIFLAKARKQIPCIAPLVHSIKEMGESIKQVREQQGPNEWVEGWGYDEGKLIEGRAPTRWDLDEAVSDAPVVITRTCTHIISVNSLALRLAGITKGTPDPVGGQIDRDKNGEPTGILRESARYLVLDKMPQLSQQDNATLLAELGPHLLEHGITAITDLMALIKPIDYLEVYKEAQNIGMKQRAVLYYMWDELKKSLVLDETKTNREKPVHIGGVKLFADGSVSGRTAWVNEPYLGTDKSYGIATTSREELLGAAEAAERHGIQLVVHAMGERAINLIIDTFNGRKSWLVDAPSIRIEHAAMPTEEQIKRAAETGIAFVPQPIFLFAEIESYLKNLGAGRTKQTYPIRSMLEAGVKVAFSSDAPATAWADPVNPFVAIKAAARRVAYDGTDTGQEQRVDVLTAITLYTRLAQEITRIPMIGQLKEGYHADFIVLDRDILDIDLDEIDQVRVDETYMSGRVVYRRKVE